jgi:hypothetical protein
MPPSPEPLIKWTLIIGLLVGLASLAWDAAVWRWRLAFGG